MKQIALILLISIFLSAPVFAQTDASYQPTPVEISQTRAQKGSEWFFDHKVLPKQTMYSICRAYGVTQQEVYEANSAALETGLKTGIDLYIP
ncbi:MAG: LysM peptidoglycan-binding domain-containing protein, partial [Bacteroidales bacterium]|nr:LysM peptidoglycan-binding domain-containing protein [Bacteroidales bacterium]